jgi:hypothetical protein
VRRFFHSSTTIRARQAARVVRAGVGRRRPDGASGLDRTNRRAEVLPAAITYPVIRGVRITRGEKNTLATVDEVTP